MSALLRLVTVIVTAALASGANAAEEPEYRLQENFPQPPTERSERIDIVRWERADHVIGNGSPESIRRADLERALAAGGVIMFNTGGQPVTLAIHEPLTLRQGAQPTVLDGMGLVTFDGLEQSRILQKEWKTELTVQRCTFINARADREGAAIYNTNWDGRLAVIDCHFRNCKTTVADHDIGGGAIRTTGQKHLQVIDCSFVDCAGANGGAICDIGSRKTIIGCSFIDCLAFGHGGGADAGPTGHGGIGGAVYGDGVDQAGGTPMWYFEDCLFMGNRAYDHAGAIFAYTRPDQPNVTVFNGCMFVDNAVVPTPEGAEPAIKHGGAIYNQYTDLYIYNCTFVENRTPGIGGAWFTAKMRGEHYQNVEMEDNQGRGRVPSGEGISNSLGRPVAAIAYLGRRPGTEPPAVGETPAAGEAAEVAAADEAPGEDDDAAAAEAEPAAPAAPRGPDEEALRTWRARVIARLQERAVDPLTFDSPTLGRRASIRDASASGALVGNRQVQMQMAWERIQDPEIEALALALGAAAENAEDHAIAAFYLLKDGQEIGGRRHLVAAGDLAEQVRSDLGR